MSPTNASLPACLPISSLLISPQQQARSSHHPIHPPKMHENYDAEGDAEFDFWGGSEIEFEVEFDDDYSLPLWKTNMSRNVRYESSPLLPHNHRFSNISPRSRLEAIAEGRRQLMEMVTGMPESSYELSLKDIVDEKEQQGEHEVIVTEKTGFGFGTEAQIKKRKGKILKPDQISRSGSMEKETFLIKMFIPISFSRKTKVKAGKGSKVSPSPSFDGSQCHAHKDWWTKRFLIAREGKNSGGISRTSRHDNTNFFTSCWPSFCKKSKSSRQRGCIC